MAVSGFTPVTFRHKLASITQDVKEHSEKRQKRHEEFTKRLDELTARYQTVISSRIRRLSEDGVIVDIDDIRRRIRAEKTQCNNTGTSENCNNEQTRTNGPEQPAPRLQFELSFHAQVPKSATETQQKCKPGVSSTKHQSKRRKRKASQPGNPNFQRLTTNVINIQRFTRQRMPSIEIHRQRSVSFTTDSEELNTGYNEQLLKHSASSMLYRERGMSPYPPSVREQSLGGRSVWRNRSASDGTVKLRKAVRKLGTMRQFQRYM